MTLLDIELVQQRIDEKGLRKDWIINQIGLKKTAGHMMLRDGLLPKDPSRKEEALKKLASILGLEVPQILLTPGRPSRRTA